MKPFEIRVPTTTADAQSLALKWKERRWCGNGHDVLGYDTVNQAIAALMVAVLSTTADEGECFPVRGFTV